MAKNKRSAKDLSPRIANRRAFHDYHITEKLETGIVLVGSEVKAIRHSQVSLGEGFARVEPNTGQLMLHNVDIGHYSHAGINQHERKRSRKLLAHKRQIQQLLAATTGKGTTLIPLAMYFVRGKVKVEIGVAEGKQEHDKRQDIKQRDADRAMRRALTRKRI